MTNTTTFTDLKLIEPILKALDKSGYKTPSPIQAQTIPHLLHGRDVLGCAQTGTGKTAAFALPILQNIYQDRQNVKSKYATHLILTPTRELAVQIYENFKVYGEFMKFRCTVAYGGVGIGAQIRALDQGVHVLVATPGRLLDLVEQKRLILSEVKTFVLDEADRMLDMGFIHDIRRIMKLLPSKRQNLLFSATMAPDIEKLASGILVDPVKVAVNPTSSTAEKIKQILMYVDKSQKKDLLKHTLKDPKFSKVIVFTRTKHGANRISEFLQKNKISSAAIHGDKSQNNRLRALEDFKTGRIQALIATDVAARGIDVDNISHVINYEIPNIAESYVHRIGRTARAGEAGIAISFCDAEEKAFIHDIEKLIKQKIPLDTTQPYHSVQVEKAALMSKGKAKAKIEERFPHARKKGNPKLKLKFGRDRK